jgi:hypothetical protein
MSALKVGFSLTKIGTRAAPNPATNGSDTVAGNAKELSLRSLLHYLWHQAELTAWTSRWAGKRHWWNIRWHLIEAAAQMMVKGGTLDEILFVPEPFRSADKAAIEHRRVIALSSALPPRTGPRKLMIVVGEVKDVASARNGHRLIIKHMPDFPFLLDETLYRRLQVRFENEMALWSANQDSHLIAIATFGFTPAGLAVVEEMALMVVSENWIPYESAYEKRLLDALAQCESGVSGFAIQSGDGQADCGRDAAGAGTPSGSLCRSAVSGQRLRGGVRRTYCISTGDRCLGLAHRGRQDAAASWFVTMGHRN